MHLPTLLLDPNEGAAKSLVAKLKYAGFPVEVAQNSTAAIALLHSQKFMAIVVVGTLLTPIVENA
ncbi:MAG: hypothetical protein HYX63_23595 [Gammaproteobacteria bacterium]|nr:hypothetical protein [Gammaproteobacteria bacterium]